MREKKAEIQSYRINKGKRVYACFQRLCGHVKDPVVRIIVWWITEIHKYHMHIRSSVDIHHISI